MDGDPNAPHKGEEMLGVACYGPLPNPPHTGREMDGDPNAPHTGREMDGGSGEGNLGSIRRES